MSVLEYTEKDTVIHKLNPLVKSSVVIATFIIVFFALNFLSLAIWMIFLLILWRLARIDLTQVKDTVKIVLFTIVFIMVAQALMYQGRTPLFTLFQFGLVGSRVTYGTITLEGLQTGALIGLRILALVLAWPLFTMTTSLVKMGSALSRLKVPYKYTLMVLMAIRFVPVVNYTWASILDAQRARALDVSKGNLISRIRKAYIPIFAPLLVNLFRMGSNTEIALASRAFGAPSERTEIEEITVGKADVLLLIIVSTITLVLVLFSGGSGYRY